MAHIAREIKVNVNTNRFMEILQQCEEYAVEALETVAESYHPPRPRKEFDIRISIAGTKHADNDFFVLEDNGQWVLETVVFDNTEEYALYLQDFRAVEIKPLRKQKFIAE